MSTEAPYISYFTYSPMGISSEASASRHNHTLVAKKGAGDCIKYTNLTAHYQVAKADLNDHSPDNYMTKNEDQPP